MAAPSGALDALLVVFVVAALLIAPSLAVLYHLDQRSRLVGHGLGSNFGDADPADADLRARIG